MNVLRAIRWAWLVMVLGLASLAHGAVPVPHLDVAQGGHCVADPHYMRLNHMKLLVHQRDQTVRMGIRGGKYSLADCVDCHASKVNHSVLGSERNFCQGCHQYAAVRPDCFECHSSYPRSYSPRVGMVQQEVKP